MSAVPPPYIPLTNFATEAQQPIVSAGLPGSEMDQEFAGLATTVAAIRSRLSEIQRDDGALKNGIVGFAALDPAIAQFAVSPSVRLRGFWTPSTPYVFDGTRADVFIHEGMTRIVGQTYVSGASFGIADETYTGVLGAPPDVGTIIRDVFAGDGAKTEFTMTQDPVSTTNVHVYVNGLLKLINVDFTLAANVVTFAVPPANLAVIITEVGVVSEVDLTTVADGTITAAKLAASSVTTSKIAALAVTDAKLAANAVTTAKLATAAVTAAKIENGAVGTDQLALGAVTADKLADGAVGGDELANGAVSTAKIATGAISTGSLADAAVTAAKIAANAIVTAGILDANVTTAKIADNAVTTAKIPDAGITPAKLSGGQSGTAPVYGARAWATIDGVTAANKTGTYSQTGTVVTVTVTAHGLRVGHTVFCDFTSGAAADGEFVVATVIDANNFTVAHSSATTSGDITLNFVTIVAAGNIASVAKVATGDLAVNFTVDMPSANYAMSASAIAFGNTVALSNVVIKGGVGTAYAGPAWRKTVGTVAIMVSQSNNNVLVDAKDISLVFFG